MPSSLVEQLQRDALDSKVKVADLLRKALVVATKLKLEEFKQWIERELEGYRGGEVPNYRKTIGQVVLYNPRRGRQPMVFEDHDLGDTVSRHEQRGPVGPLEELVEGSDDSRFLVEFPPGLQELLLRPFPYAPGVPQLEIARSSVVMIIEAVRNTILKWSLQLEADGILGADMSFSREEKDRAARDDNIKNPINFIQIHSMVNSTIQQDSPHGTSSIIPE